MKKKKKLNLILFLIVPIIIILALNIFYNKEKQILLLNRSKELSFKQFIKKNTGKKLQTSCYYNLFFLISPLDCQSCSEHFLKMSFINNLKMIAFKKGLSICISYVLTGDYTKEEKMEFISDIKNEITIYIDKKNKAKTFLWKKFGTIKTPFLIILTRKGEIKYFNDFEPDEKYGYRYVDQKLFRILEEVL